MKALTTNKLRSAGFSLVELLVAVGIIGLLASLVLPFYVQVKEGAIIAKDRGNAQKLAATFASARVAGAQFDTTSLEAVILALREGKTGVGPFSQTIFRVDLPDREVSRIITADPPLVTIADDSLVCCVHD